MTVKIENKGPRARSRKLLLQTAVEIMQKGKTPSISEVAEAAEISRATAYRCFPSESALVHAVVHEALGPIFEWQAPSDDAEARVADLLEYSMPRIREFETTFKAALKLSLEQWANRQADASAEPPFQRGHRVELLQTAIAPLRGELSEQQFECLASALSLVYGLEVLIVLQDLWGFGPERTEEVAQWAARALVRAAVSEARQPTVGRGGPQKTKA